MIYATTRQMIDAVREGINGGRMQADGGGPTPGQVHMAINQARCAAVWARHFQDRRNGDITIDDAFVVTYEDLELKYNEARKLHYIDLPTEFLDLPRLMGIVHIGPLQDPFTQCVVRSSGHLAIGAGSPAELLGGMPFCFPEGQRIFVFNVDKPAAPLPKMLVKIVPGMYWDDLDAKTAIPASLQDQIVTQLIQRFSGIRQTPTDHTNDSNTNTV